jgi:hypothetical protein
MNPAPITIALLALGLSTTAQADPDAGKPPQRLGTEAPGESRQAAPGRTPQMSEIPVMKQQGERMAVLMEQLSKESDPEVRRRIMAEAVCPQ